MTKVAEAQREIEFVHQTATVAEGPQNSCACCSAVVPLELQALQHGSHSGRQRVLQEEGDLWPCRAPLLPICARQYCSCICLALQLSLLGTRKAAAPHKLSRANDSDSKVVNVQNLVVIPAEVSSGTACSTSRDEAFNEASKGALAWSSAGSPSLWQIGFPPPRGEGFALRAN